MNIEAISHFLSRLSFREAVWLFPAAFTLHVLEEWPQFSAWAMKYASARFTRHEYIVIHLAGVIIAILFPTLIWFFPNKLVVFSFFALVFTPSVFYNALFHAGATAAFRVYCPGLLTALTVYPALFYFVSRLAYHEGLLTNGIGIFAFVLAGVIHTAEVGHNVFKAW